MPQSIFGEVKLKLKKALLFQLFVIFFITLFCALGTWQLYRLQWKLELISEITFGLDSQPIEYSSSIKKNYQRINAKGKFDFNKQIYLYSLNEKGKPGYDVVTPFRTNKNENVLVNRGWINKELKGNAKININTSAEQKIVGLLREIYKPNMFKPDNDIKENYWFSLDREDILEFTGKKFSNYIIYLDGNYQFPKPKKITANISNNHKKYAITWFSLAISILLLYLYFRKKNY